MDPLNPPATVLVKLGSLGAHAEELIEPGAHEFDVEAIKGLMADPELQEWFTKMHAMALIPVKRSA